MSVGLAETSQAAGSREVLSFQLGDEQYGIDILKVQEIRGCDAVTRIANMPEFIKGVIDLRGLIVPIVDLRVKFNLENADYNQSVVVIILSLAERVVGVVVDSVSDVLTLAPEEIKAVPAFGGAIERNYLSGVGTAGDSIILLLDIERLMASADMGLVDTAVAGA
ncbi:MAG TPA: chemotaxis protein CheW [Candidatus Acidoferrales bacterium]|jgi:purine-binding chemotaxis protein CheW|nr:chemotaxis protein CheW [Candidatus Acidoferrales bacterium]